MAAGAYMLILLETCLLALIAWPVARAVADPALRRAFPRTVTLMACLLVVGGAMLIGLARWFPALFHGTVAAAAGGAVIAVVRARPGYGRSRRLPPGRLWPLPFGYLMDPDFFAKGFARHGAVFKTNQFGIGAGPNPFRGFLQPVCCLGLEQGIAVLNAQDHRLMPPPNPASRFIPKKFLREMRPDDHRRYRKLFARAFQPGVVDRAEPFMRREVRSSLLAMAAESAENAGAGVAPEPGLLEMTFGVFARCFFGIGPEDPRFGRLRELTAVIDLSNRDDAGVRRALDEFAEMLRQETRSARTGVEGGAPSFLSEAARCEPGLFDDLTALRNLIYIMQASWIDTAGLVVWLFRELAARPEWRARVAAEVAGGGAAGEAALSVRCVRETLRLRQSEYLYRKVLEDIPVGEFVIPRGWLLRICVRESHRDPRVFENPDSFDPDRFLERRPSRSEYATFGASRIACLGEHLTLTLGRAVVEEMATSVETTTLRDGPLEYRRWHWKPSSKWRVGVSRRAEAAWESAR